MMGKARAKREHYKVRCAFHVHRLYLLLSIRSHFSLHPGTFRPLHRQHVKNCKDNQTARAATRRQDVHEWSPRVLVAR